MAFCGVITALCVMLMFLTGLIPIGTYALPGLAGVLMIVVVVELGVSWAWPVYAASSFLSFLIAPDKEAALIYVIFLGYYPILKSLIERRRKGFLQTCLLKFAIFNAAMIAEYFLSIRILNIPQESFTVFGVSLPAAFLVLANITFAFYDYALSGLVVMYFKKFHQMLSRLLHSK